MNKRNREPIGEFVKNNNRKKPLTNCDPMIIKEIGLMAGDGSFINELDLAERCQCVNRDTCKEILRALRNKDYGKAEELFITLNKK